MPTLRVASISASNKEKQFADYICTGANDDIQINAALAALSGAGTVLLGAGIYSVSNPIILTANQRLIGSGVSATVLTCATDVNLIRMGNRQSDGVMRNWMYLSDMTVNQTNNLTSHSDVLIDGGGRGTSIERVSTGGGKYGFELLDLDRCKFTALSANNPTTAGIFLEVGLENTYGTVSFTDCDAVLSNNNTSGFYIAANADQPAPNQPDRLTFINCMMYKSNGLTGCVGFYDKVGTTSTTFIGCLFEQNNQHYRLDGSGSSVNFLGCTFLDSTEACTDCFYLNGYGTFTVRDCRFQQATNVFNGASNYPNVVLEGRNNNQGNISTIFAGQYASKMGSDTVFAGSTTLAAGLDNQPFDWGFFNKIRVESPRVPTSSSANGAVGEIAWDQNYVYVCTSANSWKRTAINTW